MIVPQADIFLALMVFLRVGAIIAMIPFFGGRTVPMQYQVALAAAIALFVYPSFYYQVEIPSHVIMFIIVAAKEFFIGLMMGFAVRFVFYIADFAGTIISTEISLTRSDAFDPISQTNSTTISSLLFYLTALLILLSGTHYTILEAFVLSYKKVPINADFPMFKGVESFVRSSSDIFSVALKMAAPIIALSFVINMSFAVLGKAIPKMNVFMLSFAVRIMAGLSLVLLTVGILAQYLAQYIQRIPKQMIEFISF